MGQASDRKCLSKLPLRCPDESHPSMGHFFSVCVIGDTGRDLMELRTPLLIPMDSRFTLLLVAFKFEGAGFLAGLLEISILSSSRSPSDSEYVSCLGCCLVLRMLSDLVSFLMGLALSLRSSSLSEFWILVAPLRLPMGTKISIIRYI